MNEPINTQFPCSAPPGWNSLYKYTADLICLDLHRPHSSQHAGPLDRVTTPLAIDAWQEALAPHPDRAFANYIINGLRYGFRIGFDRRAHLRSAQSNMESAGLHPEVISKYLETELSLNRMLGPFQDYSELPC